VRGTDVLQLLSVASLGLYAGAMLTEGFVLVPYWRSLPPAEFLGWYAANDRRLVGFFGPVTALATLVALGAALAAMWARHPGRWPALLAALLMVVAVAMFFVYFQQANASFAAGTIDPATVPAELGRWAAWHRLRTALSLIALGAALVSLRRLGS
jgi:hypothetical protein